MTVRLRFFWVAKLYVQFVQFLSWLTGIRPDIEKAAQTAAKIAVFKPEITGPHKGSASDG